MATPPAHSYPSPTQAQISDGTHPFYVSQQHQPAPQAVMDPHRQHREQSMSSNQGPDNYASRAVAPHPQTYNDNQNNQEYAMQQMHHQAPPQPPQSDATGTPLSKRPKTTRACDQCRGKKTRCDPVPDSDGSQCVSCRRNSQMCEFSREPQKRGPSKGYIKELAERVGALETGTLVQNERLAHSPGTHFSATSPGPQSHGMPLSFSATPMRFGSSKRTHSMSEDLQNSPALQAQLQASTNTQSTGGSTAAMQRPTSSQDDRTFQPGGEVERALGVYYAKTHPFLPFLPHSKDRLLAILAKVSPTVHQAFDAALLVYAYPGKYSTIPPKPLESGTQASLAQMVSGLQHDSNSTRTQAEKLVVLQATLLMIFAAELNSPANAGDRGWYIQAFGTSVFMFQGLRSVRDHGFVLGQDLDAHHLLARRAFLTLVTMERWNAAGISAETLIPRDLTKLVTADKVLLGDLGYSALISSFVLGHVANIVLDPINNTNLELWNAVCDEKDRVFDGLELETTAVITLLPNFIDLYFRQQAPSDLADAFPPTRTLNKAMAILTTLANRGAKFPLSHHMVALALMILDEAIRKREVGEEARRALTLFHEEATKTPSLAGEKVWTSTIIKFVEESLSRLPNGGTTDRAGLQHLADAAVGKTEAGKTGSTAVEDQDRAPAGYLTYVVHAFDEK